MNNLCLDCLCKIDITSYLYKLNRCLKNTADSLFGWEINQNNLKNAEIKANELLNLLTEDKNEEKIMEIIQQLNSLPIKFCKNFNELNEFLISNDNIQNIPLTSSSSLLNFLIFIDKFDIDDIEKHFLKIEPKYRRFIESGKFSLNDLSTIIYGYSKYQIIDPSIWAKFFSSLNGKLSSLDLTNVTKIFLAFSMVMTVKGDIISSENFGSLFKQISQKIESDIKNLTHLDTFRICIAMTKRPMAVTDLSENVWSQLRRVRENDENGRDRRSFKCEKSSKNTDSFCR